MCRNPPGCLVWADTYRQPETAEPKTEILENYIGVTMKIRNVHERTIAAPEEAIARLISSLGTDRDELWPGDRWPRMKFKTSLQRGAEGGHGPIRYVVEDLRPGRVVFRMTPPRSGFASGLDGTHRFEVESNTLRHVLEGDIHGLMLLRWPLIVRPLHDALVEDALDKAESSLSGVSRRSNHSLWVRFLRRLLQTRT